ncbi:MAG: TonB-dependent receptor [Verrucomicrobia bacterium]|nr:TonB-dependent receptor [Verrucomicrobiota bacterium]
MHPVRTFALAAATALTAIAQQNPNPPELAYAAPIVLDDYLVETNAATFDKKAPAVTQQVLGSDLKSFNLATTVGALRNLPNLFIRERFIGDKNAPVGIRGTSNRQTGRTVVLADGIMLSNFLGTGFGNSPRWFLLAPEEIEKAAVIYGPFSALYPGNSIGGTVLFTTSMPAKTIATAKAQYFTHSFKEYGTNDDLHGSSAFVSFGSRQGRFSYYGFYSHLDNLSATTQFSTINNSATAAPGTGGTAASGAHTDTDFANNPRIIYGAEGPTKAVHDLFKIKLGLELANALQLRYTLAYWSNSEDRTRPQTYLRGTDGAEIWSGKVETAGRTFTIANSQFSLSERTQADLINAIALSYTPDTGLQAVISGNLYDVLEDDTRASTAALPNARSGGSGLGTVVDHTGWKALDVKLGYRAPDGWLAARAPSFGWHYDNYFTVSNQYVLSNWRDASTRTVLNNGNGGRTRTQALYAQDAWAITPEWTLTPGLRWENWHATHGYREKDFSGARVRSDYADRSQSALSPKLALAWKPAPVWSARLSLAEAYRFPTVGELFQGSISANGSITNNDPNLRAERALDKDLTVERSLGKDGLIRLSLFEEDVRRALISQSTLLPNGTSFSGTQNIGRIRSRGAELAIDRKKFLHRSLDLNFAVSHTDARILENPALPSSIGKRVPRIPFWQTRAGLQWRASSWLALSTHLRTASQQYNTLDNSDPRGGYGGTDKYAVVDLKATATLRKNFTASLGCDNVGDYRYYVYHPMPERTWFAEINWSL